MFINEKLNAIIETNPPMPPRPVSPLRVMIPKENNPQKGIKSPKNNAKSPSPTKQLGYAIKKRGKMLINV